MEEKNSALHPNSGSKTHLLSREWWCIERPPPLWILVFVLLILTKVAPLAFTALFSHMGSAGDGSTLSCFRSTVFFCRECFQRTCFPFSGLLGGSSFKCASLPSPPSAFQVEVRCWNREFDSFFFFVNESFSPTLGLCWWKKESLTTILDDLFEGTLWNKWSHFEVD
jgi:hypothetical protein